MFTLPPADPAHCWATLAITTPVLILAILGARAIIAKDHPSQTSWIVIATLVSAVLYGVVGPENAGAVMSNVFKSLWEALTQALETATLTT